jgi:hypothetical protein
MSYTATLIEVGGGFEKSSSHTATLKVGSVEDLRSLAGHLYEGLTIVTGTAGLGSVMVKREALHRLAVSRGTAESQRGGRPCTVDTVTCRLCNLVTESPYGEPEENHNKECPLHG